MQQSVSSNNNNNSNRTAEAMEEAVEAPQAEAPAVEYGAAPARSEATEETERIVEELVVVTKQLISKYDEVEYYQTEIERLNKTITILRGESSCNDRFVKVLEVIRAQERLALDRAMKAVEQHGRVADEQYSLANDRFAKLFRK